MRFLFLAFRALFALTLLPVTAYASPQLVALLTEKYVLLDENGDEAPAKVPGQLVAPFGALVGVSGDGITQCSATHLGAGHVATAAHCFPGAGPYAVVFYGKDGKKAVHTVESTLFMGDNVFDMAVVKVPEAAAQNWDAAGAKLQRYEGVTEKRADGPDDGVFVWSYTPLVHFPAIKARYEGKMGMVFQPNRCLASKVKPRIEAYKKEPGATQNRLVGIFNFAATMPEKDHVFIDNCRHRIVQGNSGSLVTLWNNFHYKIGVAHCIIAEKDSVYRELQSSGIDRKGLDLMYRSVNDKLERVSWNMGAFLVGVGSLFETLEKRAPSALPPR